MVALPINIQNLLRHRTVESERIEYKAAWNPDAVIRTLCAFANDFENLGGGYIVIGQDCDASGRPVAPPVGWPVSDLSKPLMLADLQEVGSALADYANELSVEDLGRQKPWATSSAITCTRRCSNTLIAQRPPGYGISLTRR